MGLRHASGPYRQAYGTAGSAFSAGDPLVLTAGSLLSGVPLVSTGLNPAAATIVGVAMCDSDDTEPYPTDPSGRTQVAYIVADRQTNWFSDLTTGSGSSFSVGDAVDLEVVANITYVTSSANTPCVRIMPGGTKLEQDQSDRSQVIVQFDSDYLLYRA